MRACFPILNFIVLFSIIFISCKEKHDISAKKSEIVTSKESKSPTLTLEEANRITKMPFECMQVEYPNKLGQTLNEAAHIKTPKELHPAFYGCFDWHSSVHGHWTLVTMLKKYPNLNHAEDIKRKLRENISKENIAQEIDYFTWEGNNSYERTYGWAWLLKLSEELHNWDDPLARELEQNLQPLVDRLVSNYLTYLPKLNYPIRVGTHNNTAFGMSFAYDYAKTVGNTALQDAIEQTVRRFYADDKNCPLTWEPSGYDFLSPCFEEANIVRKVYPKEEYAKWLDVFLPQLKDPNFKLETGKVSDRADGKLVHLDGLNFSRAWCLYGIANTFPTEYAHLRPLADEHIRHSLPSIVDDNYSGTHWLGSFAVYAMKSAE